MSTKRRALESPETVESEIIGLLNIVQPEIALHYETPQLGN
jgi:hypothetical protein